MKRNKGTTAEKTPPAHMASRSGRWERFERRCGLVFVAVLMAALALPFLLMPVAPQDESAELQELKEFPAPVYDGHLNVGMLAQMGDWYDDHFAFRQQFITANARVRAGLLGTSPTDQVVVGSDGWLYYGGTLNDYQRTAPLSDRVLDNAAFNLSLAQEYVEGTGATFTVAVAPDKNSLYGATMPYYLPAGEGPSNWDRLKDRLDERGVAYTDLKAALAGDETLYLKTDSHWNTRGAYRGFSAIARDLALAHGDYSAGPVSMDDAFVGDIEAMLYPLGREPEPVEVFEDGERFGYVQGSAVTDATVETVSEDPSAAGSLVAYRDSFGNAVLPFFATASKEALFSKMVPYDFGLVGSRGATAVLVERGERHISLFATDPPIMAAPERDVPAAGDVEGGAACQVEDNGPYWKITGVLDEAWGADDPAVLVLVEDGQGTRAYEAFHVSRPADEEAGTQATNYAFSANIPKELVPEGATVGVVVGHGSDAVRLAGGVAVPEA